MNQSEEEPQSPHVIWVPMYTDAYQYESPYPLMYATPPPYSIPDPSPAAPETILVVEKESSKSSGKPTYCNTYVPCCIVAGALVAAIVFYINNMA